MAQRLTDTLNACALHRHSIGATVRIRLTLSAAEGLKIRIKTHRSAWTEVQTIAGLCHQYMIT